MSFCRSVHSGAPGLVQLVLWKEDFERIMKLLHYLKQPTFTTQNYCLKVSILTNLLSLTPGRIFISNEVANKKT